MPSSRDSTRPIMAPSVSSNRASKRFSTISGVPSLASQTTTSSGDSTSHDIKAFAKGLERLDSKRLQQQRYSPSTEKSESLSKIALGAKVERALDRRMGNQDAFMRPRSTIISEKR
ncbi:MAG: hypothetical protein LQ340_006463 [Diploschistes diacapsis]|nr:MAG: hypothetical protein LQ340_006463 [Diploschistes diacapsis]